MASSSSDRTVYFGPFGRLVTEVRFFQFATLFGLLQ